METIMKEENLNDWKEVKVENCLENKRLNYIKLKTKQYREEGEIPIIDQSQDFIAGYTSIENKFTGELPIIIFGDHTLITKYVDFPFAVGADGTKILYPKSYLNKKFFYYLISNLNIKSEGYQRHFKYLKDKFIYYPSSLQEQERIAEILSNVDNQIEKTQEIITKSEEIKQGLMQELLIKGIGHKSFKEVELNNKTIKIPKDWELVSFGKYLDIKSGKGFKLAEYSESGVKLLKIDNVSHNYISWENTTYLPENYLEDYKDLELNEGDILLALNRPITQDKLKIAFLEAKDCPCLLYQRVGKIVLKKELNSKYVYFWLSLHLKNFILSNIVGGNIPFINISQLRRINFYVPPLQEQEQIANILSNVDNDITKEKNYLNELQDIKKGLMQELLSGRVRVK